MRHRRLDLGIDMVDMITVTYTLGDRIRSVAALEREATEGEQNQTTQDQEPEAGVLSPRNSSDQHNPLTNSDEESNRSSSDNNIANSTETNSTYSPIGGRVQLGRKEDPPLEYPNVDADGRSEENNANEQEEEQIHGYHNSSSNDEELDWGDSDDETESSIRALEEAAATPLFEGSELSSMGTTYLLLNFGKLHACTDVYMDELFRTLSTSVLPKSNSLPSSYRAASQYVKRLEHSYKSCNICPNNCRVYRNTLANVDSCLKCRAPRKKRARKSLVPHKVLRHFPLIPRLKRMFRSPVQAAAMTWWALHHSDDGVMRHVSHSKQWKWIND